MSDFPVIAVDGPAGSGKGTLARRLAAHFGFDCLDTGLLYRAVGAAVLAAKGNLSEENPAAQIARDLHDHLNPALLDKDPSLRTDEAAQAASKVSAIPAVRVALLDVQHSFAGHPPGGKGAVLDGRDIGTVICPAAPVKLFITASIETRAARRQQELHLRGFSATYDAVLADLVERDARDSSRATAPLKPAADAVVLDTTDLDPEAAFAAALAAAEERLGKSRS